MAGNTVTVILITTITIRVFSMLSSELIFVMLGTLANVDASCGQCGVGYRAYYVVIIIIMLYSVEWNDI